MGYLGECSATTAVVARMGLKSDLREAMWGLVQPALSELDFDFGGYAETHFERPRAHLRRPRRPRGAPVRERAGVVVIGGGVGGCSIAYRLTALG